MKKSLIFAVLGTVLQLSPLNIYAQWQRTNGPYGGQANCIASDGANIYAGSSGGVFLSNNNGSNWKSINYGLTNTDVQSLAISGSILLAGTGGGGVFISTNNGNSWKSIKIAEASERVNLLAISGTNIFAGCYGEGVFLSHDNGNSWISVNTGLTNPNLNSLVISGTNIFAATGTGVFLSTNNGDSWIKVNNGLTKTNVQTLAVSGANIFAGTGDGGVFLSSNNGDSWSAVNNGLTSNYIMSLAEYGTSIIAGTGTGVFISSNKGASWVAVSPGFYGASSFAFSGTNILSSTGGGLYLSTNGGYNWTEITNGFIGTGISSLAMSGTSIFAGAGGGKVFISSNRGFLWSAVNNDFLNNSPNSFVFIGTSIFAGTSGGVFLSTDQGITWSRAGLNNKCVISMAISGTNIYAGTWGGMYLSTDNGNNWTAINNGLPANTIVESIAISGTNIYIGAFQGGVFLSTDNGSTWTAIKNGLPTNTVVLSLAISGANMFAGTSDGVFLSTNYGDSWTAASSGLLNSFVRTIAISGKNIFAGTDGGIFLSTNNGSTWVLANSGFPTAIVNVLTVFGDDIFAGTNGAGVWYRPVSDFTDSGISKPLSAGWTWFSLNVANQDMSMAAVLGNLKSTEGDYIKNQTVSATYYDGAGWFGELTEINPVEMYKIKLAKADTLKFDGITVDPLTNPVTIKSGWNWIGYLPQLAQSVAVSLSSISPVANDYIKNQTKSSTFYEGTGWFGELTNLEPLDGFMLKTSHTGTLIFPSIIPTVTTSEISVITRNNASGGGEVTGEGSSPVTERGICWSSTPNPTLSNQKSINGAGMGTYLNDLTTLKGNTTYYVRAYATNSAGTAYGNQVPFTTAPYVPVLGEFAIVGTTLDAPNTTIYTDGNGSSDSKQIPAGEICTVTQGDSLYFVFNEGKDTVLPLNRDNSSASLFRLMFGESEEEGVPLKSGNGIVLQTGVKMEPVGDGTYNFTNLSARWVGVQVDNRDTFLLEAKKVLPEISIGELAIFLVGLYLKKEPVLVENCVYSIGSPVRAYLNTSNFSMLLNSEVTKSIREAKLRDPRLLQKVITADMVSLVVTATRKIMKTVLAAANLSEICNNLIVSGAMVGPIEIAAWGLISSDSQSEYDDTKEQVYNACAMLLGDLTGCIAEATCKGLCAVVNQVVKKSIDYYNNRAFVINLAAGSYQASILPAYDEYCLNGIDGTFTDARDGHIYKYKTIGTQTWMAENLAYLPAVSLSSAGSEADPYYYVYGYEGSTVASAKATANYTTYGVLYNWPAALTACPSEWHLPTDAEWTVLTDYLTNNGYGYGGSGSDIGKSMAATSGWTSSLAAGDVGNDQASNNSSGFTALPGGIRYSGGFDHLGVDAYFWSASASVSGYFSSYAWFRLLAFSYNGVGRDYYGDRDYGWSVRCLQN